MNKIWLLIEEAASLESTHRTTINRKLTSFTTRQIPSEKQIGKAVTQILLTSLSPAAQRRYHEAHVEHAAKEARAELQPVRPANDQQQEWFNALPVGYKERVAARLNIVQAVHRAMRELGRGRSYGVRTEIVQQVAAAHDVSRGTVFRLLAAFEAKGIMGFADDRFGQRRAKLSAQMEDYIKALIKAEPHIRASRVRDKLESAFGCTFSYTTVHRWMAAWKSKEHNLFTAMLNPDAWKNEYQPAFGNQSEKATHFLHYVEMDSTPADILCADGKRYTLIGAIDVYSRKVLIHVADSSSGTGIAELFRRILTEWGVPENIVKDNGKDYVSKHVVQIQAAFAIHSPFVPHFTPEAKPHIERFFGTLTRGLEESLEGYIGHSVADRKAIEAQKSFAQRFMGGKVIELTMTRDTLQEIIDTWLDRVYHQRRHSSIGIAPAAKAAQSPKQPARVMDLDALEVVLLKETERTVFKKGIKVHGRWFIAPELATMAKTPVRVRLDKKDATLLHVYSVDGRFICGARDESTKPMSLQELNHAVKHARKDIREKIKAIKTVEEVVPNAAAAIAEYKNAEKKIHRFVGRSEFKNEALTEAARAAAGIGGGSESAGDIMRRTCPEFFVKTGTD